MTTLRLTAISVFFFSASLQAEEDFSTFRFDAMKGHFVDRAGKEIDPNTEVDAGNTITIEIINVNTLKYDVIFNSSRLRFEGKNISGINLAPSEQVQTEEQTVRELAKDVDRQLLLQLEMDPSTNIQLRSFLEIQNDLLILIEDDFVSGESVKGRAKAIVEAHLGQLEPTADTFRKKAVELWERTKGRLDRATALYSSTSTLTEEVKARIAALKMFLVPVTLDECVKIAEQAADLYHRIMVSQFRAAKSIQMTDEYDVLRFTVKILSKEEKDAIPKDLTEFEVYARGKWHIDFSAGLLFSDLVDESYTITTTTGTDMIVRQSFVKQKDPALGYGISGLMHLGYRVCSTFYLGAIIGTVAAASGNLASLQFVVGLAPTFGRYQRFSVGVGMILGSVKRLQEGYKEGIEYAVNLTEAPTRDVTESGMFFTLTYSIPSLSSGSSGGE